jgi:hypothetical protein
MMSKFSREGTDGHSKGLKLGGQPAFEEWKKKQERLTLTVLIEDRFLVTLEGRQVQEDEARNWIDDLPLEKLATWAKEGTTGDNALAGLPAPKDKEAKEAVEARAPDPTKPQ